MRCVQSQLVRGAARPFACRGGIAMTTRAGREWCSMQLCLHLFFRSSLFRAACCFIRAVNVRVNYEWCSYPRLGQ